MSKTKKKGIPTKIPAPAPRDTEAVNDSPSRRKTGRPRKITVPDLAPDQQVHQDLNSEARGRLTTGPEGAPRGKESGNIKKRGRPRKTPAPAPAQPDRREAESENQNTKKKGRPRKVRLPDHDEAISHLDTQPRAGPAIRITVPDPVQDDVEAVPENARPETRGSPRRILIPNLAQAHAEAAVHTDSRGSRRRRLVPDHEEVMNDCQSTQDDVNILRLATQWHLKSYETQSPSEYFTTWNHLEFPDHDVKLSFQQVHNPAPRQASLTNLKIQVSGPNVNKAELKDMIHLCESLDDPGLLFRNLIKYFTMTADRSKLLRELQLRSRSDLFPEGNQPCLKVMLLPNNEDLMDFNDDLPLANFWWLIHFDSKERAFSQRYKIWLSEEGSQLAQELCFPLELLQTGTYESWTAEQCIQNLYKMTQLSSF